MMAELEKLRGQLGQNSSNSSRPPSSDPPQAPKRAARKGSDRKPGGQAGHEGRHRQMVCDPDMTVEHPPERCDGCGAGLGDGEVVGDPVCHQVWELPATEIAASHRAHEAEGRLVAWHEPELLDLGSGAAHPMGVPRVRDGEWPLVALADALWDRGLRTRATPSKPRRTGSSLDPASARGCPVARRT